LAATEFPCPDSRLSLVPTRQAVPTRPASAPAAPNRPRDSHPPPVPRRVPARNSPGACPGAGGIPARAESRRGWESRRGSCSGAGCCPDARRSQAIVPAVLSFDCAAVITLQDLTDRDLRAHESVSSGSRPRSGEGSDPLL
jgi:hypothetical protein